MRRTLVRFIPSLVLLSLITLAASGGTQSSSGARITAPIDSATVAVLPETAHPVARLNFDRGRTNPGMLLEGVTLTFRLSPAQQADMDRLLREQQEPSSPNYHKWLTPDQYAARFGMSDADLAKVTGWLQSQSLKVDQISRSRTEISFSGTVAQIEHALHTQIHNYVVNGATHFANATDLALPAAFAGQVLGIRSLDNFQPKPHYHQAHPNFTSNLSGNHFLEPGDFAIIYNLVPLYNQGLDGTGQKIAVVGQTTINLSDVQAFRSASGLPANNPTFTQIPNTGPAMSCTSDLPEADLDVEWSGGVAPGAKILYYFAGVGSGRTCGNRTFNVFNALNYVIQNNVAPVVSISYGNCEANIGLSRANSFRQLVQHANLQGQTVIAAAGDDGAADCDFGVSLATQGLAVDIPAAIPEVTGIGGTEFNGDASACPGGSCTGNTAPATQYWSGSSSLTSGPSAVGPIPERVWNDTCFPQTQCGAGSTPGTLAAGGGGTSTFFLKPSWQAGTGVPADGQRDVPDISLNASPAHDPYLFCTPPKSGQPADCTNGFRDAKDNLDAVGGTSAGAPTFAGIMAIINQATNSTGQGNANQILYSLASGVNTSLNFNDINTGNNTVPCKATSTDCPNGGNIGFNSTQGYDQASGLGSIDAFNLVTSWNGFASGPNFSITANPSTVTVPTGRSGTSTITVSASNSFSGTVQLSCSVPSGATTQLSCSLSPASVSITSGNTSGTATLTLSSLGASGELRNAGTRFVLASLFGFAGLVWFGLPVSRLRRKALTFLLFGVIGLLPACGGGETAIPPQNKSASFSVTVNGTSGSISHGTTVGVTVQ